MKRQDEGVTDLGKEVGGALHIVHIDFPPGKVLFSFGRCNQIRSTLIDTVDGIQQSGMVSAILFVTPLMFRAVKGLTFSLLQPSPDMLCCTATPL